MMHYERSKSQVFQVPSALAVAQTAPDANRFGECICILTRYVITKVYTLWGLTCSSHHASTTHQVTLWLPERWLLGRLMWMYKLLLLEANLHLEYTVSLCLICKQVEGKYLQTGMAKLVAVLRALLHAHYSTQIHPWWRRTKVSIHLSIWCLTCVYSHVHIVTHRSSDHRTVYMEVVCVHVQYE